MNTTEVIVILARKLGISQAAARQLLHERLRGFTRTLIDENIVELPGLGTIETQLTQDRRQYIPSKHSICLIPTHKRAVFKINNLFKARLKRDGSL